ncbi:MAG TPA: alpha/beta fold hydrolase [Ktedonobacterales bacterium]|jgi:pimeloyl-ACP methyl ester carboxylesterase
MRIQANDIHLGYDEWGAGKPLVLLHAFPCNRSMWAHQINALVQNGKRRVITPDFRGFGESDVPEGPYLMETLADDIAALLDALQIEDCVLGGLSMGGYVAFAFYRAYSSRVRALILADTRPQADSQDRKAAREEMAQLAERQGSEAIAERQLPLMLTPETLQEPTGITARLRAMMEAATPTGIAETLRGMALRPDSTDLLPQIHCPTLVLGGAEDTLTPPADAHFMAERIPNARLAIISHAAHLANLEQPEVFNQALDAFLEEQA